MYIKPDASKFDDNRFVFDLFATDNTQRAVSDSFGVLASELYASKRGNDDVKWLRLCGSEVRLSSKEVKIVAFSAPARRGAKCKNAFALRMV